MFHVKLYYPFFILVCRCALCASCLPYGFRSFWSADLCCLLYGSCVPSAGLSVVSCNHTKISISFGSYKSLEKFICEDVWMLMGGGWGLSLILLFRVVFVPLACGRDTNQKEHG